MADQYPHPRQHIGEPRVESRESWTSLSRWFLNVNQLSWACFPSRALSHGTRASSLSLKRPRSALLKFRAVSLQCALLTALDLGFQHVMVVVLKPHICHQPVLVSKNKGQHSTSPHWLLYHLEKKLSSAYSRDLVDFLCLHLLCFPGHMACVRPLLQSHLSMPSL